MRVGLTCRVLLELSICPIRASEFFHAGPAILLVTLFASVVAPLKLGLQLDIIPWVGQYLLLAVVLGLFLIPKGLLILDQIPSCKLNLHCCKRREKSKRQLEMANDGSSDEDGLGCICDAPHDDEDFDSDLDDEEGVGTRSIALDGHEHVDVLNEEAHDAVARLGQGGVLVRQLLLAIIEIALSVVLFSPELIIGCIRMLRGMWSQVTGKQNWVPQDVVEKQVELELSFMYVFKQTWQVFVAGLGLLTYAIIMTVNGDMAPDPWLFGLVLTWMLYPVTTYFMCLPVPDHCKQGFLWIFVMDIKQTRR